MEARHEHSNLFRNFLKTLFPNLTLKQSSSEPTGLNESSYYDWTPPSNAVITTFGLSRLTLGKATRSSKEIWKVFVTSGTSTAAAKTTKARRSFFLINLTLPMDLYQSLKWKLLQAVLLFQTATVRLISHKSSQSSSLATILPHLTPQDGTNASSRYPPPTGQQALTRHNPCLQLLIFFTIDL